MSELCEICNGEQHEPIDHPYLPKFQEINLNPKDPEGIEEGGLGSGRASEFGPDISAGPPAGELVTFETVSIPGGASGISIGAKKIEETIMKNVLDTKLSCQCKNSHPK